MNPFDLLTAELKPRNVTSAEALYQNQESQSAYSLAEVYQPFDPNRKGHWRDRGAILDFALNAGPGDVLDIGPGDGWPSLPMARFVRSVTGLDASPRRVDVCTANARRMGVTNFRGALYQPGEPLPFADGSFDGVTAAHSLEQTPNPVAMLREIHRVLRPGGKLRMAFETLAPYGEKLREIYLWAPEAGRCCLLLIDRRPAEERALQITLVLKATVAEIRGILGGPEPERLTGEVLTQLKPLVADAMTYELRHPSTRTWLAWLEEAGFASAVATPYGADLAGELFGSLPEAERPGDLAGVDALLQPLVVERTVQPAPVDGEFPITAAK